MYMYMYVVVHTLYMYMYMMCNMYIHVICIRNVVQRRKLYTFVLFSFKLHN